MTTYDWIVIGGGITGSALAYELSKKSFKVLLLEKDRQANNATFYSYGGLAYWSGTTPITRQLGKEGIELQRNLTRELAADTEFQELDLLLTVNADKDPIQIAQNFQQFAIQPEILAPTAACNLEPLLNADTIAGVLKFPHGKIDPHKTTIAYQQALLRHGGAIKYERVTDFIRHQETIKGVITANNDYQSANTVVCAGGLTHSLLKKAGITTKVYFTHAQVIKTKPVDIQLSTIVMPALQKRFALEATAQDLANSAAWETPQSSILHSILDAGAVQMKDNSLLIGQISALITDPHHNLDNATAEQQIRQSIAPIMPSLAKIPGTCRSCLVAFNTEKIATIGKLRDRQGIYLFSGFTSTIVFAPPLARRFANWVSGEADPIIEQLI